MVNFCFLRKGKIMKVKIKWFKGNEMLLVKAFMLFIKMLVSMFLYASGSVVYFALLIIGGVLGLAFSIADKFSEHRISRSLVDKSLGLFGYKLLKVERS